MKTALLPIPALLLAACVSSGPESQLGTEDKAQQRIEMTRTSDCVYQSTIDGFDALDDTHVVLFSMGQRKAYLAEVEGACFDVRSQSTLAAIDGDQNGQICGFGRDSIAYHRMGRVENCRILGHAATLGRAPHRARRRGAAAEAEEGGQAEAGRQAGRIEITAASSRRSRPCGPARRSVR